MVCLQCFLISNHSGGLAERMCGFWKVGHINIVLWRSRKVEGSSCGVRHNPKFQTFCDFEFGSWCTVTTIRKDSNTCENSMVFFTFCSPINLPISLLVRCILPTGEEPEYNYTSLVDSATPGQDCRLESRKAENSYPLLKRKYWNMDSFTWFIWKQSQKSIQLLVSTCLC